MFRWITYSVLLLGVTTLERYTLTSQALSYHLQFSEKVPGITRIILVNDSAKKITALHLSQRCTSSGSFLSLDAFDNPPNIIGVVPTSTLHGIPITGIDRGESVDLGPLSRDDNHECNPQIDAVIFADGGYDGKAHVVQGMKARRDGIMAGVEYWGEKANSDTLQQPGTGFLVALAKRCKAEDHLRIEQYSTEVLDDDESPLHQYWEGRYQVDSYLVALLSKPPFEEMVNSALYRVKQLLSEWKRHLEKDVSMSRLNAHIPSTTTTPGKGEGDTQGQPCSEANPFEH